MSHTLAQDSCCDSHQSNRKPMQSLMIWLASIILTLGLFGDAVGSGPQKRRSVTRPRVTTKPATERPSPAIPEDVSPQDPAIVGESRKLAARRLEELQRIERDLLSRNISARTPSNKYLEGFLQAYPLHSQMVALSDAEVDGSRTLIISEPPPHVTLGNILTTVGGDVLLNHNVVTHKIGFDGWVKDVVIGVKGDDEALQAMLSRLHQRLFFTSYKSYTLKLPVHVNAKPLDLNLAVTPEETKRWIVDEREKFFPVEGGSPETLAGLASSSASGVYISSRRGLIGWWIPKGRNIYECRIPARQFALDADLVIGAIATNSGILVLGRERIVPVEVLPPLRFETLALLADVQNGQEGALKQSYERKRPFAGTIEGERDWAPILLSPELRDTEYGSLLNITDQLLKGWSNMGQTKYENFPYADPGEYPFPKPLWEYLAVDSLTYNWNTKGTGYTVAAGPLTFYALNRSGSLPVSYIPEGLGRAEPKVIAAEDTGYNYFSRLSDPNLVRVVQYAGMYQIFSAFNIARSAEKIPTDSYPDQLIQSLSDNLYAELRRASDQEIADLARQAALMIFDRKSLDEEIASLFAKQLEQYKKEIDAGLRRRGLDPASTQYKDTFDKVLTEAKKEQVQRAEGVVTKYYQTKTEEVRRALELVRLNRPADNADAALLRREVLSRVASIRRIPQQYAAAIDLRSKGWIHTSVVVVSWNIGAEVIGGHNLDARVSKIVSDPSVLPGQVKINAKGDLLVNPLDLPRARGLARIVERGGMLQATRNSSPLERSLVRTEVQNALSRAEVVPIQPRESALHLGGLPPKPPINKPSMLTAESGPAGRSGWGGEGRSSQLVPIGREPGEPNAAVLIRMRSDGRFDLNYTTANGKETVKLPPLTNEDAVDAAAVMIRRAKSADPIIIEFEGMPEHKIRATLETMKIRMGDQGQDVELIARSLDESTRWNTSVLSKEYNFQNARVETSEISTLATGELSEDVSLEVPGVDANEDTLRFTTEITFDKSTPRGVISAVKDTVSDTLNRIVARWKNLTRNVRYEADVRDYNNELARALKKVKGRTKLDFGLKTRIKFSVGKHQGLRDVYISERERVDGECASSATAGQSE